ncbi:MAG: ROK family protein [Candidatus Rokuibacteriota bacterium]|nr:MAG: ROK family protein [Candidatus Rokubacteria bacterium]
MTRLVGGLEAGGTKFVCAIGTRPDDVRAEARFPTTTPEETIPRAVAFFARQMARAPVAALGVASFGPLDLDRRSPTFGFITTTPKTGWRQVDLAGLLRRALGLPIVIDTDVNAAALAEHRWGHARGIASVVYITVGSGIGGGALVGGRPLHGLVHPEMGHLRLPHDWERDPFPGTCPHHGDCWEGLASAPALAARWGRAPESLPDDHLAWDLEAHYLALGLANVILVLSPGRLVIGGGVMARAPLLALTRARLQAILAGYLRTPALAEGIDDYVVRPALADRAGVLGALALAQTAVTERGSAERGRT